MFRVALPFCHVSLKAPKPLPEAYPKAPTTLGDHLRKKRLDMGLLQREVAVLLGVHASTINNWENNLRDPSSRRKDKIVRFLAGE